MNAKLAKCDRSGMARACPSGRAAFTLVELLIVIAIIALLVTIMGAVIGSSIRKAREAATTALIQKLDGMLEERAKGFDRATKSLDFQRVIAAREAALRASGVFGVSPKVLAAVARKDFFRANFPQRFEDLPPFTAALPTVLSSDPLITYNASNHQRETESSALLYYMITRMQVFGVPPVGDSEFGTSEIRDTDGDGLLEFVDGWGRPLRFYRWPTRLLKPNGIKGIDNQFGALGVDDDGNGTVDDLSDFGKVNTDDVTIPSSQRAMAGLLIEGLPSAPVIAGQWDTLSEDPDDPYGLISTEVKRLFYSGTNVTLGAAGFNEMNYPTIDTYHTPLIVSVGADGDLGLFEPYQAGTDSDGDGVLDTDMGILAQPIHGPAGPYDFGSQALTPLGNDVLSALTGNITNRNRRAGKGK